MKDDSSPRHWLGSEKDPEDPPQEKVRPQKSLKAKKGSWHWALKEGHSRQGRACCKSMEVWNRMLCAGKFRMAKVGSKRKREVSRAAQARH